MNPPAILGLRGVGEGVATLLALNGTEGEAGGCGDALWKKLNIPSHASLGIVTFLYLKQTIQEYNINTCLDAARARGLTHCTENITCIIVSNCINWYYSLT